MTAAGAWHVTWCMFLNGHTGNGREAVNFHGPGTEEQKIRTLSCVSVLTPPACFLRAALSLPASPKVRGIGAEPSSASPSSSSSQPTTHQPGASQHSCDPASVQTGRGLGEGHQREHTHTPGQWTKSSSRDRMPCFPPSGSKGNARQRQRRIPASCLLLADSSCQAGASPGAALDPPLLGGFVF